MGPWTRVATAVPTYAPAPSYTIALRAALGAPLALALPGIGATIAPQCMMAQHDGVPVVTADCTSWLLLLVAAHCALIIIWCQSAEWRD